MTYLIAQAQDAPGQISVTADVWTTDTTRASYLGMTGHWIEVRDGKWELKSSVIGFRVISGDHSGNNLGRYFASTCQRMGIITDKSTKVHQISISTKDRSHRDDQLGCVTLDNAANNGTTCQKVSEILQKRNLFWNLKENQLP